MRFILCIGIVFFTVCRSFGQTVQWASQLIEFSSEFRDKDIPENSNRYRARQVLGYPNTMKYGKSELAWAPAKSQAGKESIMVGFSFPQTVQQVIIGETLNSGSVEEIILYDNSGKKFSVYQNQHPIPTQKMYDVLTYFKIKPAYNIVKLKLILNTNAVIGMQQIDCIGISSATTSYVQSINVIKYSETVDLPENLGPNVNSEYYDHLPMISPDGSRLYFTRKFAEQNIGKDHNDDIYYSYIMTNGKFSKAENIGPPLNNENNNFICFISSDNNKLYTANKYIRNSYNYNGLSYSIRQKNGAWSKPKSLDIPNLVNDNEFAHYHVSLDEQTVLMAIQRPDSYGDMDLYVSQKYSDGSWSAPKNLGPTINTVSAEGSVFLAADGKTLYFSSAGHPGFGSYDMYMSKRLDNSWTNWSKPLNLGDKINTDEMDIYYTIPASGDYAYFSSGKTYFGLNDLYRIRLPREIRPEPVDINRLVSASSVKPEPVLSTYASPAESPKTTTVSSTVTTANMPAIKPTVNAQTDDLQRKLDALKQQQNQVGSTQAVQQTKPVSPVVPTPSQPVVKKEVVNSIQPYQAPDPGRKVLTREELAAQQTIRNNPTVNPNNSDLARLSQKNIPVDINTTAKENKVSAPVVSQPNYVTNEIDPAVISTTSTPAATAFKTNNPATDELQQKLDELKRQQTQASVKSSTPQPSVYTANKPVNPAIDYPNPTAPVATANATTDALQQKLDALKQQQREVGQSNKLASNPWQQKPYDPQPPKERQEDKFTQDFDVYQQKLDELKKQQKNPTVAVNSTVSPDTKKTVTKSETNPTSSVAYTPQPSTGTNANPVISKYEEKLKKLQDEMAQLKTPQASTQASVVPDNKDIQPTAKSLETTHPTESSPSVAAPTVENSDMPVQKTEEPVSAVVNNETISAPDRSADLTNEKAKLDSIQEVQKAASLKLTDMLDKLGSSKQDLEKDIVDLQSQRTKFTEEKDKLASQNATLESEKSRLELEKKQMDDLLLQMQAERDKLAAEKLKMEQDKAKLDALKKQQEREVLALKRSIDSLAKVQQQTGSNTQLQKEYDLFSVPLVVGAIAQVNNIYFVADASYLQIPSYPELDKVVAFLKKNNKLTVEIGGHTNGLCDDNFCQKLSTSRAKTCVDYLISKGIDTERLSYKGYGKTKLLLPDKPDNPLNQRVEIKILSIE